jgi:hypothetical protein
MFSTTHKSEWGTKQRRELSISKIHLQTILADQSVAFSIVQATQYTHENASQDSSLYELRCSCLESKLQAVEIYPYF